MTDKPVHSMTPGELADAGIPVEVALQARLEKWQAMAASFTSDFGGGWANGGMEAYRDAIAIVKAQKG